MHEPSKEDDRKRSSIILDEHPNVMLEQWTLADDAAEISDDEYKQCDHDRQIECLAGSLTRKDLDAFLEIDKGDVEAKDVTREARYVFEGVARVGDCKDEMHNHSPSRHCRQNATLRGKISHNSQTDQTHESKVIRASRLHDLIYGAIRVRRIFRDNRERKHLTS